MVRVACCQIVPEVGDAEGNRRRAREAVREAVDAGARLVVLPELSTSGYVFESEEEARVLAQPADGGALRDWADEAARGDAVIVGGFAEAGDDGLLYNSAAVVDATGAVAVYRKLHLWDREKLVFEPGSKPAPVVETLVGRVGVAICYDLYFPELVRGLALAGADVVALPTNSPRLPRPDGEPPIEITIAAAQAHLNRVFFAVCDRAGRERGVDWVGGSVVCDENGWVLAGPPDGFGPGLVLADCEFGRARDKAWGERNDVFGDRRPEVYRLGDVTAVA
ncbi:MAG: carbon-nitrogen hydrolase [Actinomycetota bacterium]|nr:carbon-nitrogen hydrolase [Actinomycetota bacterium]